MIAKTYRKKPVKIEAMQWGGTNTGEIISWIHSFGGSAAVTNYPILSDSPNNPSADFLVISTLEGSIIANVGDYVIKGVRNEFYPCKADIFEETYEEVD